MSNIKSATTRHIVDLAVSTSGDDGLTAGELEAMIAEDLGFRGYEVVFIDATPDIGLAADELAFCHDPTGEQLYFPVAGTTIRQSNDENNYEPFIDTEVMLEFGD
jgi:hypothetical protein